MGLQPARGVRKASDPASLGDPRTHDGLMRWVASLDYSGKGVDPMAMRVKGRGKKAKQGETRVPTVGGYACGTSAGPEGRTSRAVVDSEGAYAGLTIFTVRRYRSNEIPQSAAGKELCAC